MKHVKIKYSLLFHPETGPALPHPSTNFVFFVSGEFIFSDGGRGTLLRNVGTYVPNYTASNLKKRLS
jgi:hypothetical protein